MLVPAVYPAAGDVRRVPRLLVPSLSDWLFLAILLWSFAVGSGWTVLLADGDTGWHIRTGEYILNTHSVPVRDLFSFSKAGQPWFAWEWLSDVIFAVLHRFWGLKGVVVFTGLVLSLAATLLFRYAVWRGANVLAALVATVMLRRLMRAGFRGPNALKMLYGSKVILAAALPVAALMATAKSDADPSNKILFIAASLAVGFFGPNEYVRHRARKRQKRILRGLPNALDLMVVCVESGLGLDQAVVQVAKELQSAYPEISEEFSLMNLEMKAGKRRADALRNLADRTGVEEVKKLVAVLVQADRFGTSVAQSLRGHSEFMRVQTRQQAEEKAAKLGVKLVFPIFFCILPSLFVVTVGPVIVRIVRELIPMMVNM